MWVCSKCVFDEALKKLTVCVFDCTIYGLCAHPGVAPHGLERGQLLLEIYSTSPQSSAKTAELWASSSHPGSRRKESRAEEETCSFFSLSQGLSYDFPNKYEPRETDWLAIHQPGCLHPPEQCVNPPHPPRHKEGHKRVYFHLLVPRAHSLTLHEEVNPGKPLSEQLKEFKMKNKNKNKKNQKTQSTANKKSPLNDCLCNAFERAHTINSHTWGKI